MKERAREYEHALHQDCRLDCVCGGWTDFGECKVSEMKVVAEHSWGFIRFVRHTAKDWANITDYLNGTIMLGSFRRLKSTAHNCNLSLLRIGLLRVECHSNASLCSCPMAYLVLISTNCALIPSCCCCCCCCNTPLGTRRGFLSANCRTLMRRQTRKQTGTDTSTQHT